MASGRASLDDFQLDASWQLEHANRSVRIWGTGVGIWEKSVQFPMTREQILTVVNMLVDAKVGTIPQPGAKARRPEGESSAAASRRADGHRRRRPDASPAAHQGRAAGVAQPARRPDPGLLRKSRGRRGEGFEPAGRARQGGRRHARAADVLGIRAPRRDREQRRRELPPARRGPARQRPPHAQGTTAAARPAS